VHARLSAGSFRRGEIALRDEIHRLSGHGYDLLVDAGRGASLLSLGWTRPDGQVFEVLQACPPAIPAQNGGCFVMAPFANRLENGRFELDGRTIALPVNRPADRLAIHGFSRDHAWQVLDAGTDAVRMIDRFDGDPFVYSLVQTVRILPDGVDLALELTSEAPTPLPYGFGFHPWFRKEPQTYLSFTAETSFDRSDRGFAENPGPFPAREAFAAGVDTSAMPWFDGHFAGWDARSAQIEWRSSDVRLTLRATGALGNLHVYVPDDRPVLCVEPVSHVPDVHNRRELAPFGDLAWLEPGETMAGAMRLSLTAING
jgi:aldose 1-epimerase